MQTLPKVPRLILFVHVFGLYTSGLLAAPSQNSENSGLTLSLDTVPDHYILSWWGLDELQYMVQFSDDLHHWSFVPEVWEGEDAPLALGYSSTADRLFFRALGSDDPQSDLLSRDYNSIGLSAWNQIQLGYNPFDWVDVDDNGLHDAWELHHFGATGVDLSGDDDFDGLTNWQEFLGVGDPLNPDSNADAISDLSRYLASLNPAQSSKGDALNLRILSTLE